MLVIIFQQSPNPSGNAGGCAFAWVTLASHHQFTRLNRSFLSLSLCQKLSGISHLLPDFAYTQQALDNDWLMVKQLLVYLRDFMDSL